MKTRSERENSILNLSCAVLKSISLGKKKKLFFNMQVYFSQVKPLHLRIKKRGKDSWFHLKG